VAIIMAVQFLLNGLIALFYHLINNQQNKETVIKESIKDFTDEIVDTTNHIIRSEISNQYNYYLVALRHSLASAETHTRIGTGTNAGESEKQQNESEKRKIGFELLSNETNPVTNTKDINTISKISNTENQYISKIDNTENRYVNKSIDNQNRICLHCGKHYTYKHHKQKYCCDDCRTQANVNRTGKTLRINGVVYKPQS